MKPAGHVQAAGEAEVRVPTRRALAKQQTRAKVLAAARELFSEQGYEGATIRDIAAAAGMSTGAVFANFADKSDLFREIMFADMATLAETMADAARRASSVDEALIKVFSAGYGYYAHQLPLARAAFSISWAPEGGQVLRQASGVGAILDVIAGQLESGVARGELIGDVEVRLRARMLFDCYLSNFPDAIFSGWSVEALEARSRDQIRIVLAGARPG